MDGMAAGVLQRLQEWIKDRLRRDDVPEFRTREDYARWKATQQPQQAEPTPSAASGSTGVRPESQQKVLQGPPLCPYCGESFPSFPKRKRKCPNCENVVVIWRGRDRKQRVLVTEARAAALTAEEEKERARISAEIDADPERRFRRVARIVDGLGISDGEVRDQLGISASEGDAAWSLLNKVVSRCMAKGDFETLSFAYFIMARRLDAEKRDFRELLRQANKMKLLAIQQQARESPDLYSGVSIIGGGGCDACRSIDGRQFPLEEAIRIQPLPCQECSSTGKSDRPGWCRCLYLPVLGD